MIQIKRGYTTAWNSTRGTLAEGQPGIEIRTAVNPTEKITTGELRVGKIGGGTFSDAIRVLPKYYSYNLVNATESTTNFTVYLGEGYMYNKVSDMGFRFLGGSTQDILSGTFQFPNRTTGITPRSGVPSIYSNVIISGSYSETSLRCGCGFNPAVSATFSLGDISEKWSAVWATTGQIQTSDKKSKTNIKAVLDVNNTISSPSITGPEFEGQETDLYPTANITINDLVDCLKKVDTVTFNYLDINNKPDEHSYATQLGLIADDILEANSNVFKYIGTKETIKKPNPEKYHQNITEVENFGKWVDKEGNVINEYELPEEDYVIEDELGLQPLPVATMSLAINKHLLNEIDKLKEEISELKSKLNN